VRNQILASDDQALNVLAVKDITFKPADIESHGTFDAAGITWEKEPLDLSVGRSDCGHAYERTVSLALPADTPLSAIHTVMFLRCAEQVKQGTDVGSITVVGADGSRHVQPLRAGIEIAESALAEPSVLRRAQHQPTVAFPDPDAPNALRSEVSVRLPMPVTATRLEIHARGFEGWMVLSRLTVERADGGMLPQAMGPLYLSDPQRWRELRRIRTSRYTDRGRDETNSSEQEFVVYENLRAMPRAWIVPAVVVAPLDDVLPALQTSQLPDGRPFDPSQTALVAKEDDPMSAAEYPAGPSAVTFGELSNGRMAMSVTTSGGGFLVVSESYYPGWRATIDGQPAAIHRANYSMQGVVVPAGTHQVVFSFTPTSLYFSGALSVVALVAAMVFIVRRTDQERAPLTAATAVER
jgi:hypothetical protein